MLVIDEAVEGELHVEDFHLLPALWSGLCQAIQWAVNLHRCFLDDRVVTLYESARNLFVATRRITQVLWSKLPPERLPPERLVCAFSNRNSRF